MQRISWSVSLNSVHPTRRSATHTLVFGGAVPMCLRGVLVQVDPKSIVFMGDNAGATLVVLTLLEIIHKGLECPGVAILFRYCVFTRLRRPIRPDWRQCQEWALWEQTAANVG